MSCPLLVQGGWCNIFVEADRAQFPFLYPALPYRIFVFAPEGQQLGDRAFCSASTAHWRHGSAPENGAHSHWLDCVRVGQGQGLAGQLGIEGQVLLHLVPLALLYVVSRLIFQVCLYLGRNRNNCWSFKLLVSVFIHMLTRKYFKNRIRKHNHVPEKRPEICYTFFSIKSDLSWDHCNQIHMHIWTLKLILTLLYMKE